MGENTNIDQFLDVLKKSVREENIIGHTKNTVKYRIPIEGWDNYRIGANFVRVLGAPEARTEYLREKLSSSTILTEKKIFQFYDYGLPEKFGQPISKGSFNRIYILLASDYSDSLADKYNKIKTELGKKMSGIGHEVLAKSTYLEELSKYPQEIWDNFVGDIKTIKEKNLSPNIFTDNIMTDGKNLKLKPSGMALEKEYHFKAKKDVWKLVKEVCNNNFRFEEHEEYMAEYMKDKGRIITSKILNAYFDNGLKIKESNVIYKKMTRLGFKPEEIQDYKDKFESIKRGRFLKDNNAEPRVIDHLGSVSVFADAKTMLEKLNRAKDHLKL